MNAQLYQEFLDNKHLNKTRARAALTKFIASFENDVERENWTREFLETGEFGHKIRHELYREVIFPVLVRRYKSDDAWAILQLARTINNLAADRELHSQIDYASSIELLKESYTLSPVEELRVELLQSELRFFNYSAHEWPAGILWGNDGATLEQCQGLLEEVHWTRSLDASGIHQAALDSYENKVREYQQRLASRS